MAETDEQQAPDDVPEEHADPSGDPSGSTSDGSGAAPAADDVDREEIEAERKRRLDPANRPENAEIDNSDVDLPTVAKWDEDHPVDAVGTADPSEFFRENPPDEKEQEEMAAERERRLAPENRPEGAEVDNTGRTFEDGHFVD